MSLADILLVMGQSQTTDGITLTTFAHEHVDPLFKQAGARKRGRRYEFVNATGDISLFELHSRGYGGGLVGFDAGCLISPRSQIEWLEWTRRDQGNEGPSITHLQHWLWSGGIVPPPEVQNLGHWGFHDASSAQRCGKLLAAAITTTVIPLLARSMDRRWLLEAFFNGGVFNAHRMVGTPERTRVLLLIDDGPSDDLARALGDLDANTEDPRTREQDWQMLRWARHRLTQPGSAQRGEPRTRSSAGERGSA